MENKSKISRRNSARAIAGVAVLTIVLGFNYAANMMLTRAYRGKWNFLDF